MKQQEGRIINQILGVKGLKGTFLLKMQYFKPLFQFPEFNSMVTPSYNFPFLLLSQSQHGLDHHQFACKSVAGHWREKHKGCSFIPNGEQNAFLSVPDLTDTKIFPFLIAKLKIHHLPYSIILFCDLPIHCSGSDLLIAVNCYKKQMIEKSYANLFFLTDISLWNKMI